MNGKEMLTPGSLSRAQWSVDHMRTFVGRIKPDSFLFILIGVMIIFAGIAVWRIYFQEPKAMPAFDQGKIDLSEWDFIGQGNLPLNGKWEFYPGRLLQPKDFDEAVQPSGYQSVPGAWSGSVADRAEVAAIIQRLLQKSELI
jgi:hypothetical protein